MDDNNLDWSTETTLQPQQNSTTCQSFLSADLLEVRVKYEMQPDELERLKLKRDSKQLLQPQGNHQEALETILAQSAQLNSPRVPSYFTRSSVMPIAPTVNADVAEAAQTETTGSESLSASPSVKIPDDIYSWRKYGRIQVKSPECSRSYYKCTYNACNAKKIESCDQFNSVPKIVYKGQHKHDAPKSVVSSGGKIILAPQSLKRKSISTHGLNADVEDADQKDTMGSKSLSASQSVKIPNDIYRWRKYGQKQVKSPEGSRSYYKCTYSGCNAKKIVLCDQSNSIPKIVYKGQHRHDTPKRVLLRRGKMIYTPKSLKGKSISSQKQRVKKSSSASPGSVPKQPKKPKFIVHAAADIEISADGYNWRKYGQKMVKENPHPRNYYKCTSAGCTVKKYIEKVDDGSSQVIITYKGVHNHNVPVSKKR